MKKGDKLRENGYLLQIKDIHDNYVFHPVPYRSLRQAVAVAADYVQDMDNYLKVYREFTAKSGTYIAVFFSKPGEKPQHHLIIQITDFELLTAAGTAKELEYIERISQKEPKASSG